MEIQNGLTETFVFAKLEGFEVWIDVVALEVWNAKPNAIAEIMIVFFMMNDFWSSRTYFFSTVGFVITFWLYKKDDSKLEVLQYF